MGGLGFFPAAEAFVDGEEFDFGEEFFVFFGDGGVAGAVEVAGDEFLGGGGVEEFEVGLGDGFHAVGFGVFVDDGDRGFGEDGGGGGDDGEFVLAEFSEREEGFVFPGEENVALAALGEGERCAAGAGIKNGDMFIEIGDEGLGFGFVVVVLFEGPAPGGEVVPAGAAGGFGVWGDDLDAGLDEVGPVFDGLGVALADEEDDGAGVGGAVLVEAGLPVFGEEFSVGGDGVDVGGEGEGDDVGLAAVDDGAGLAAGAAVGVLDGDGVAGAVFGELGGEGFVDGGVEFTGGVVGDVVEGEVFGGGGGGGEEGGGGERRRRGRRGVF